MQRAGYQRERRSPVLQIDSSQQQGRERKDHRLWLSQGMPLLFCLERHISFVLCKTGKDYFGKKIWGAFLFQWLHVFEEGNDKLKEYCANTTEFWTISVCIRDRGQNTQRGQIPSIHSDSKGFLSRKDARETKQKSQVRHCWHQGKLISIWAPCARIQTQMLGEHPTA